MPTLSRRTVLSTSLAGVSGLMTPTLLADLAWGSGAGRPVRRGGEEIWRTLGSMPYVPMGSGNPIYMLMSQSCGICQLLWRQHAVPPRGVEYRFIAGPYGRDSMDQVADLAVTRSPDRVDAYMSRRLRAPGMRTDNRRIHAFNTLVDGVTQVSNILRNNGMRVALPNLFWMSGGQVYTQAGYSQDTMPAILSSVAAG
ncbi:MAG: hypothetical protein GVY13_08200 [Alphaproteobacteria bacterium]|jgi:hypothetical protein|nr:hypothetical protein [Alphaproteobacteria bacterium]